MASTSTPVRILKQIAQSRINEARALLREEKFDAARYIAGYAIEVALKARICTLMKLAEYPPKIDGNQGFKTHNLEALVVLAGLGTDLDRKKLNVDFAGNWSTVTKWSEQNRYLHGVATKQDVEDLLKAIASRKYGIFPWIRSQW